jgi:hypothetical protein
MAVPTLFADVTIGAWGRIILSVAGSDVEDSETMMDMGPNWGSDGGRIGFSVRGNADKIGFVVDVNTNGATGYYTGGNIATGDQLKIWIKPIEMVTISAGRVLVDSLRGKFGQSSAAGDHLWISNSYDPDTGMMVPGAGDFEDKIFARNRFSHGVVAEIVPMEGVTINAGINYETAAEDPTVVTGSVEATVNTVQVSAGYNIEGIGLIRAQYLGYDVDAISTEDIQAAFALTMVEGLLVDIGLTIDVNDPDVGDPNDPMVALGASYQISDAISATLCANTKFSDMIPIFLALTGTYNMGDVSLNAELAFNMIQTDLGGDVTETDTAIEIYPFARLGLGNGYCSAGVKISMSNTSVDVDGVDDVSVMMWTIPIVMEYWF